MTSGNTPGKRIRQTRQAAGLKQVELAALAGISASYLNLIEHDRRKIAGKLLLDLSKLLKVEASLLSEGAEEALILRLNDIAAMLQNKPADTPSDTAAFAAQFSPWANRLIELFTKHNQLEQLVNSMADRLSHDPNLATSLFEVLSSATAIRSTSAILAETKNIEPEWQNRFHRNLNEDSRRLAVGAQALVGYLDPDDKNQSIAVSPRAEMESVLAAYDYYFPELEEQVQDSTSILAKADKISVHAQKLLQIYLQDYAADARALPKQRLASSIATIGHNPIKLAQHLGLGLATVMRRLTALAGELLGTEIGLVICDASGSLLFHRPVSGFKIPTVAGFCALWPVFEALQMPMRPFTIGIKQNGRDGGHFETLSYVEISAVVGGPEPILPRGYMMLMPLTTSSPSDMDREVGATCRLCTRADCSARREVSVFTEDF